MLKNTICAVSVAVLLGVGAQADAGPSKSRASDPMLMFGKAVGFHNITLIPVSTKRLGPFKQYTLLEAGIEAKTLQVRELKGNSGEARVAAVEVRNRGKHPVFLLGGEMILGGKQDRIIEADTVVPANRRWQQVGVFCVEQGRWSGGQMQFKGSAAVAHAGLRKAAMSGEQGKVWAEVARNNSSHGTQNATQTYRRTIQNAEIRKKITHLRSELRRLLPKDPQMAGFVFAINGKIRVADLLGNPDLFSELKEKLVSAYILEALEHQVDPNAPELEPQAAEEFFEDAADSPSTGTRKSGKAINYKKKKEGLVGEETVDEDTGEYLKRTYLVD